MRKLLHRGTHLLTRRHQRHPPAYKPRRPKRLHLLSSKLNRRIIPMSRLQHTPRRPLRRRRRSGLRRPKGTPSSPSRLRRRRRNLSLRLLRRTEWIRAARCGRRVPALERVRAAESSSLLLLRLAEWVPRRGRSRFGTKRRGGGGGVGVCERTCAEGGGLAECRCARLTECIRRRRGSLSERGCSRGGGWLAERRLSERGLAEGGFWGEGSGLAEGIPGGGLLRCTEGIVLRRLLGLAKG